MRCFECLRECGNPDDLFAHLKNQHKVNDSSDYRCSECLDVAEDFRSFKKHVRNCFNKKNRSVEIQEEQNTELIDEAFDIYNDLAMECSDEITEFKELLDKSALRLVLKMTANMSIPRNLVFKTISYFQEFIDTYMHGLKTIIPPCVRLEEKGTIKSLLKAVKEPFKKFDTENKLDSFLTKSDLMKPIDKCLLLRDPSTDDDDDEVEEGSMILMPIIFTFKNFFDLPEVFDKIEAHTNLIRQENKMNHFINGELWKEKLSHYDKDDTVIPYFLYIDGAQMNNVLGPHHTIGEEQCNYITFPTIPTEYQSRLENIIVASICPHVYVDFGIECIFCNVVEELKKLANECIVLTINGRQKKVFFLCGTFIGDNKESNIYLGFMRGFRANYYCRFCRMHRNEMESATIEIPEKRRNRQNYNADVLINKGELTGVLEYSFFNEIPWFHVTDSTAEDGTHNIELGCIQYNFSASLSFLINRGDFTLEQLNERIRLFDYSDEERQNIPMPILEKHLETELKLKMTAAETSNFAHNITFILKDLVEEGDVVWDFILQTVRFYDLSYLPCYIDEDIEELTDVIDVMHFSYINLFDKTLKPVHHFAIHYPKDIRRFGPLRYLKTIRCEGKHKPLKNYARNTMNRIFLSYSIGKKVQYNFVQRLFESKGLEDIITAKICSIASITSKLYYEKLEKCVYSENITNHICHFTDKVEINGMVFKIGLWLPAVPDSGNYDIKVINEICDILMLQNNSIKDIFAVCKTYSSVVKNDHYGCYVVNMDSVQGNFVIINISEYLKKHHYPVKVHNINGKFMFRCKRF